MAGENPQQPYPFMTEKGNSVQPFFWKRLSILTIVF